MKLAKLILPMRTNEDKTLFLEHQLLRSMFIELWGGFTATHGVGGWKNDAGKDMVEPVWVYEIAMPLQDVVKLREVAAKIGRAAKQDCVMIVTPHGDVDFVKPGEE